MNYIAEIGANRLKQVLVQDKNDNPSKVIPLLKSEVYSMLNNYFEINRDGIVCCVDSTERGIEIEIRAIAVRSKSIGFLPN